MKTLCLFLFIATASIANDDCQWWLDRLECLGELENERLQAIEQGISEHSMYLREVRDRCQRLIEQMANI